MSFRLVVNIPEQDPLTYQLQDGHSSIGSSAGRQIQIAHGEVGDLAAEIDVRGQAIIIYNRNPYQIFVGERLLERDSQCEWPVGAVVALTENVTLVVEQENIQSIDEDLAQKKKKTNSQLMIVGLCVLASILLLTGEDDSSGNLTQKLHINVTSLVLELKGTKPVSEEEKREKLVVLNYLVDARIADIRWGGETPSRAISAYELLLDVRAIREASAENEDVNYKIRKYALARVGDLSTRIGLEQ